MTDLPEHLGGHANITNNDEGALKYLIKKFNAKSFLDIGCGPGGMLRIAQQHGLSAKGIDGDYTLNFEGLDVLIHDFTKGPAPLEGTFDLGWCVEVLEHVEEQYLDNLRPAFQACSALWITHAMPGQNGWHHVNCRSPKYWHDVFKRWGFQLSRHESDRVRHRSTMRAKYSVRTGTLLVR